MKQLAGGNGPGVTVGPITPTLIAAPTTVATVSAQTNVVSTSSSKMSGGINWWITIIILAILVGTVFLYGKLVKKGVK
jgi:hypothetical protein